MAGQRTNDNDNGMIEKIIQVNRVAKVVKGGRRFRFSAVVVVGDGNGKVGYALGKANEVSEAIRKSTEKALRHLYPVEIEGRTIPHSVVNKYGATRVVMKPCQPGKGVLASSTVRAVMEAVGIQDVSVKTVGSNNPHNVLKATLNALGELRSFETIARRRGVPLQRLRRSASQLEEATTEQVS